MVQNDDQGGLGAGIPLQKGLQLHGLRLRHAAGHALMPHVGTQLVQRLGRDHLIDHPTRSRGIHQLVQKRRTDVVGDQQPSAAGGRPLHQIQHRLAPPTDVVGRNRTLRRLLPPGPGRRGSTAAGRPGSVNLAPAARTVSVPSPFSVELTRHASALLYSCWTRFLPYIP